MNKICNKKYSFNVICWQKNCNNNKIKGSKPNYGIHVFIKVNETRANVCYAQASIEYVRIRDPHWCNPKDENMYLKYY